MAAQKVDHHWQDLRKDPLDEGQQRALVAAFTPKELVNRASTTWRQFSDQDKNALLTAIDQGHWEEHHKKLLFQNPTVIKRPVFLHQDFAIVGFKADIEGQLKQHLNISG